MLPNLNLYITSNIGDVTANLGKFSTVTVDEMKKSAVAVGAFDKSVDTSASSVSDSAGTMGDSMKSATDSIITGTEAAGRAIEQNLANVGKEVATKVGEGLDTSEGKVKQYATAVVDHFKTSAEHAAATAATFVLFGSEAAAALTLAFNAVAVLTLAYKGLHFAVGLVNGESYKSENIDALIAENKRVQELQTSLHLTAVEAEAMNDALRRLGVNQADIQAVQGGVSSAVSGAIAASKSDDGTESELDRLGVKYKDLSGHILENEQVVQNAKNVLDQYTEGWDRNQAAAALGIGSYEQINNYLKVSQAELQKSKSRLDEYNLGIGPETQTAVANYEDAMRQFRNEQELMSQGFKRAVADNIMPALTDLALFFKDGWPSVVNVFRYTMAEITSLGWGLKTSYDVVFDSLKGGLFSVGDLLIGIAKASALALTGDFAGAKNALVQGWDDAKARIGETGAQIVRDAQHNAAAMKQAWAFDDRRDRNAGKPKKGKPWNPKPDAADEEEDESSGQSDSLLAASHNRYLAYLKAFGDREAAEVKAAAAKQTEINKEAYDWGLLDLQTYLDRKHALSEKELQDEIKLRQADVSRLNAEVKKYSGDQDAKGLVAYHDALAKEQEAKKALVELEGRLGVLRLQNADESKTASYDQLRYAQEQKASLLELQGAEIQAAAIRRKLDDESKETMQLIAAAMAGNQAAADAYWAKEAAHVYKDLELKIKAGKELDDLHRQTQSIVNDTPDMFGNTNTYGKAQSEYEAKQQELDRQIALEVNKQNTSLEKYREYLAQKKALEDQYNAQQKAATTQQWLNVGSAIEGQLGQIAGMMNQHNKAQFEAYKQIAAVQAVIATALTVSKMLGATSELGPAAIPLAIAAGAIGAAQVGIIESQHYEGREFGGDVQAGQTYIVGEKRPELFTPGVSGTITPYVPNGGGSVSVVNHYDFRNATPESEQRMRAYVDQSSERTKAQILDNMNRGGRFAVGSGRMK